MAKLKGHYPLILLYVFWGFLFIVLLLLLLPANSLIHQTKVCNLSQSNLFFVGREEHLQQIKAFFKKGDKIVLALTGGPGFGKTQMAKKYAHTFHQNYDLIWWIDAGQDISSQYEKLALALNTLLPKTEKIVPSKLSREALVDTVKNLLRLKKIKYLLIFDNPETYAQVDNFVPTLHHPSGKHVLLTSRNANIWLDKIEIKQFKREESLQMIQSALPKEKKEDMIRLAETLGDYPLGLTLALSFIKSHPTVSINKYIAMHFKRPLKEGEETNTLLDRYPRSALGALEISLDFIEKESKDSLQALYFMSLLNSKDIPESYIELWLKKAHSSVPADDTIKHIYDQSLMGVSETTEFNGNKKLEGKEKMYYLSIHDLIHQLINESIPLEEKKALIEKATAVMNEIFAGSSQDFSKKILQEPIHLLHAQKLCENARIIRYSSSQLLQLKICIFECLMGGMRNFNSAKIFLDDIESDLKAGHKIKPYYMALYNMNKGFFETTYPNYEKSIYYMQQGLLILNTLKEYDEEILRALTNLAQYHTYLGETNIAESFIEKGKMIFERSQSEVFNCLFLYVWGYVLNDQGKFEESINVLRKTKLYPTLGINYPTIELFILYQEAQALLKLNRLKEAYQALRQCEIKAKEFYGSLKNPFCKNILFSKSLILIQKNEDLQKAINNLKEALQIYRDTFHGTKKHNVQGRIHLALGKAYVSQKNYTKALKEYLLSAEVFTTILKEKKIDDVSDLYTDLALLGTDLKDEGITHKYLKAHIETFGLDHPRTEKILNHLDRLNLAVPN